jgi:2-alkyl-3-oxoalkanoate reductase
MKDKEMLRIAITGATGLVGRALVRRLSAAGHEVVALARNENLLREQIAEYRAHRADVLIDTACCDIADGAALAAVFASFSGAKPIDVVVHAAGFVSPTASRESIFSANVDGTKNCLQAAAQCGVRQFIFISSLSVITGQGDCFDLDETAPYKPSGEAYGDSKIAAEKLVVFAELPMKTTVLRPGFIYGPGERAWLPRVIESVAGGRAVLVDGGLRLTNVVYVENLAEAVLASLLNEAAYGQVFNITDPEKVTKKQLFNAIADGLGRPHIKKRVPRWLLSSLVEIVAAAGPALPTALRQRLAFLSRAAFRLTSVNQGFSIAKAERLLHYNNLIAFEVGMKRTMERFSGEGMK